MITPIDFKRRLRGWTLFQIQLAAMSESARLASEAPRACSCRRHLPIPESMSRPDGSILLILLRSCVYPNLHEMFWSSRETARASSGLRFRDDEIIIGCFQNGRTFEWAQAHFFVSRDTRPASEAGNTDKGRR